jgi:CDP-4-dehydro-6-deoxyglucose reductase
MPVANWYDGVIRRIEARAPNTRSFWLEIPELPGFDFKPGQFITMDLPIHEKRLQRWRSYSIASAPDGSNTIELCIVRLDGGLASTYLFDHIQEGTSLRFKGPGGAFTLPDTLDKDLVLICTGTGVAPFRSMLLDIVRNNRPHRRIHLVFGTRYREGVLYEEEFVQLQQELPGFTFSVALSRETDPVLLQAPFEIRRGYVHPIYLESCREKRDDVLFYLCGWSMMVDEAILQLGENLGYPPQQIRTERYG